MPRCLRHLDTRERRQRHEVLRMRDLSACEIAGIIEREPERSDNLGPDGAAKPRHDLGDVPASQRRNLFLAAGSMLSVPLMLLDRPAPKALGVAPVARPDRGDSFMPEIRFRSHPRIRLRAARTVRAAATLGVARLGRIRGRRWHTTVEIWFYGPGAAPGDIEELRRFVEANAMRRGSGEKADLVWRDEMGIKISIEPLEDFRRTLIGAMTRPTLIVGHDMLATLGALAIGFGRARRRRTKARPGPHPGGEDPGAAQLRRDAWSLTLADYADPVMARLPPRIAVPGRLRRRRRRELAGRFVGANAGRRDDPRPRRRRGKVRRR